MKKKYYVVEVPAGIGKWKDQAKAIAAWDKAACEAKEVEEVCQSLTRSIKKIYKVGGKLYCTKIARACYTFDGGVY